MTDNGERTTSVVQWILWIEKDSGQERRSTEGGGEGMQGKGGGGGRRGVGDGG